MGLIYKDYYCLYTGPQSNIDKKNFTTFFFITIRVRKL